MNDQLSLGFVILSPEHNVGKLQATVNSIKAKYSSDVSYVCATGKDTIAADLKEMNKVCPTYRGKDTITSLINTGMKKGNKEWNILVIEGAYVRAGVGQKYSRFMEGELDIFYPVLMDKNQAGKPSQLYVDFVDAPLNGMMFHQKTFKKIGEFGSNPLQIEKLLWALDAISKGCRFKGVLGTALL